MVPLTFVPAFPVYPPETAWMREPDSRLPGLVLNDARRRAHRLPAGRSRPPLSARTLPDHANLLANLVRWAAGDRIPLRVQGAGLVDCHLYRQPGRLVLHLVNLTNAGTWRAPIDEIDPHRPAAG